MVQGCFGRLSTWVLAVSVLVSSGMALGITLPAHAQDVSSQLSDAQRFFAQLAQKTDNPMIAAMAQESLSKLRQDRSAQTPFSPYNNAYNTVAGTPGRRHVEIPLILQQDNSLAVPVVLENKAMGTFIIDTGATHTVITPRLARKLGVKITPETPRVPIITANGYVQAPIVKVKSITVGEVEVHDVDVVVRDLGDDLLLAGLLGMNFFKNMDLTIKEDKIILGLNAAVPQRLSFNP